MLSFGCCKYYIKSSDEQFVSIEAGQQGTGGPVWLPLSPPSSPSRTSSTRQMTPFKASYLNKNIFPDFLAPPELIED